MKSDLVFASYSRADTEFVRKLSHDLIDAGVNLWVDVVKLSGGAVWDQEIEKALTECKCLLFIVSPASIESNNVLDEVYTALEDKKRIIPIKIAECRLPFRLKRLQFIDLTNQYEEGIPLILSAINIEKQETEHLDLAIAASTEQPQNDTKKIASPNPEEEQKILPKIRVVAEPPGNDARISVATVNSQSRGPKTKAFLILKVALAAAAILLIAEAIFIFRPKNTTAIHASEDSISVGKISQPNSVDTSVTKAPEWTTATDAPTGRDSATSTFNTPNQKDFAKEATRRNSQLPASDVSNLKNKSKAPGSNSTHMVSIGSVSKNDGKSETKIQDENKIIESTPEASVPSVYVQRPLSRKEKAILKRDSLRMKEK